MPHVTTPYFSAKVSNGVIRFGNLVALSEHLGQLNGRDVQVTIEPPEAARKKQRTLSQNAALHKYFSLVADALNDAGYDMRRVLKAGVEIPWDGDAVKSFMWRPIQKIVLKKESTTELETKDIDLVWEVLNRHLGEKFGIHEPFPSIEEVMRMIEK